MACSSLETDIVQSEHKGMDVVSSTQVGSVGTKGPKVCLENIFNTMTSPCLKLWYKAGWIQAFMLFERRSRNCRLIRPGNIFLFLYCPVLITPCKLGELHVPSFCRVTGWLFALISSICSTVHFLLRQGCTSLWCILQMSWQLISAPFQHICACPWRHRGTLLGIRWNV